MISEEQRNDVVAYVAGALFAIGWWLYIDALAYAEHVVNEPMNGTFCLMAIFSSVALIGVNLFSVEVISSDGGWGDDDSATKAKRLVTWISLVVLFASCIASVVVFVMNYGTVESVQFKWPGISLMLHNGLNACSALLYKFARVPVDSF